MIFLKQLSFSNLIKKRFRNRVQIRGLPSGKFSFQFSVSCESNSRIRRPKSVNTLSLPLNYLLNWHHEQKLCNVCLEITSCIQSFYVENNKNISLLWDLLAFFKVVPCSKGRKNDFEIFLNGQQIFSKRSVGYFPDLDAVLSEVGATLEDESHRPRDIQETETCCTFRYTACCQVS